MKKFLFIIMLTFSCIIVRADIVRQENDTQISYFDTQDNTEAVFLKDSGKYQISQIVNGVDVYFVYPEAMLPTIARMTFQHFKIRYTEQKDEQDAQDAPGR